MVAARPAVGPRSFEFANLLFELPLLFLTRLSFLVSFPSLPSFALLLWRQLTVTHLGGPENATEATERPPDDAPNDTDGRRGFNCARRRPFRDVLPLRGVPNDALDVVPVAFDAPAAACGPRTRHRRFGGRWGRRGGDRGRRAHGRRRRRCPDRRSRRARWRSRGFPDHDPQTTRIAGLAWSPPGRVPIVVTPLRDDWLGHQSNSAQSSATPQTSASTNTSASLRSSGSFTCAASYAARPCAAWQRRSPSRAARSSSAAATQQTSNAWRTCAVASHPSLRNAAHASLRRAVARSSRSAHRRRSVASATLAPP